MLPTFPLMTLWPIFSEVYSAGAAVDDVTGKAVSTGMVAASGWALTVLVFLGFAVAGVAVAELAVVAVDISMIVRGGLNGIPGRCLCLSLFELDIKIVGFCPLSNSNALSISLLLPG